MEYEFYSKPSCYTFHELFREECCVQSEFMQKVEDIRKIAAGIHAGVNQYYDGSKPYVFHLDMVVDQMLYLYNKAIEGWEYRLQDDELLMLIFAAYFHDTIEDCRLHWAGVVNYAKLLISHKYAEHAADIVFALTEEKGKTRADRHCDKYFDGIASIRYASIVKTADICANTIYSWYKSEKQYNKYLKEWRECNFRMMDDTGAELSHRVYNVAVEHMKEIPSIYPTENPQKLLLSKEDMENIGRVACDFATGHHLICPRAADYLETFNNTMKILSLPDDEKTGRDKQITEYFNACSEPVLYNIFCGKYGIKNENIENPYQQH